MWQLSDLQSGYLLERSAQISGLHRFMAKSHIFDENATVTDPDHLAGLGKATLGNMICVGNHTLALLDLSLIHI